MDREEPRWDKSDLSEVEFRPRAYRGPSHPSSVASDESLSWKIGVAVGVAVLIALLLFNMYERHQDRKDAEQALRFLERQAADWEKDAERSLRAISAPVVATRPAPTIKPVPPGYRCSNGVLLHHEGSKWTQITARSRHIYCPEGGGVQACYYLTPRSVGCR